MRLPNPESLVVKVDSDQREWLLDDAPDTYCVPAYYRPYPVVLVRLAKLDRSSLHDLLATSVRLLSSSERRATRPKRRAAAGDVSRRGIHS